MKIRLISYLAALSLLTFNSARSAPVVVSVSFQGPGQTATWSQTIAPGATIESTGTGVFFGVPYSLNPDPQIDPVAHAGGITFTNTHPVSLADDGALGGPGPPTPITTQFTFDDTDWSLLDIENLHLDLLGGESLNGDWNAIPLDINLSGVPGSLQLDLFHTSAPIDFWQTGSPTIGNDGSFTVPGTVRLAFNYTLEGIRPVGSELVHGSGITMFADGFVVEIPLSLTGNATTTAQGGPFPQDVLLELDGDFDLSWPFDEAILIDEALSGIWSVDGLFTIDSEFLLTNEYHLETVLESVHVPEPHSLTLMLFGLSAFGFLALRIRGRKHSEKLGRSPPSQ